MFPLRDTIPSRRAPVVTWALIAVNCLVFAYQLALPEGGLLRLFHLYGVVPARFSSPAWALEAGYPRSLALPFFTSMFLHGGFFHLLSNMWTLWIFGDNVEDRMGRLRYLAFYLLCGLGAGLVHWLTNLESTVPTIGASGAIAGVLGAYLVLYPQSRVITLVPLFFWPLFFEIPAVLYLGFWFVSQLLSGASALASGAAGAGGVAWWAHVGGFLAGVALYRLFLERRPQPPPPPPGGVVLRSPCAAPPPPLESPSEAQAEARRPQRAWDLSRLYSENVDSWNKGPDLSVGHYERNTCGGLGRRAKPKIQGGQRHEKATGSTLQPRHAGLRSVLPQLRSHVQRGLLPPVRLPDPPERRSRPDWLAAGGRRA